MSESIETVGDTLDAYKSLRQTNRPISGIILDLTIPGSAGGKEAVTEIRRMDADVPVFVASGYADDPIMKEPTLHGFTASINKPFMKFELAKLLNEHLKKSD